MPHWLGTLLAIAVLVILGTLMGWVFSRHGSRLRGHAAMASILLGFGSPLDPPTKQMVEAKEGRVTADDERGEPPTPEN